MKHLFLTVITGFLFASGVMAQSALRGVVTSRKDQPLSGATVQIKEVPFEVVTDDAGRFAFFNLKNDQNYSVVATFIAYRSETK
ncbi:MAG: carboxypeptidase regulatory-like domain-containing protein, partial [Salinivirgaceae bacterium]|nr:carboxypeptidase regulatory-like domain-containing protein [Salinivirgaceae bacterium]